MFRRARFSGIVGYAVATILASTSASAQSANWRTLRIDGSTPESFQASVASLQNALSSSARDDFETALAAIWIGNTTTRDLLGDVSELRQYSEDLLADIHRGDLVAAIEDLDVRGDEYSTADYFEQLDGLGYEAVLDLAGLTDQSHAESQALRAYKAQLLCRDIEDLEFGTVRAAWCEKFFRSQPATAVPHTPVGATLNTAREALNVGDVDAAEAAIDTLNLERLTPYERGFAETLLFHIKYRQGLYSEARAHLQAAVDTQSMTEADTDAMAAVIEHFDRAIVRPLPRRPGAPESVDSTAVGESVLRD